MAGERGCRWLPGRSRPKGSADAGRSGANARHPSAEGGKGGRGRQGLGLGRQAGLIESRRSADHAAEAQLQPGDHAGFQGGDALLVPAAEAQAHQQEGGQIPELGIATAMAAPFLDQFAQLAIATELA